MLCIHLSMSRDISRVQCCSGSQLPRWPFLRPGLSRVQPKHVLMILHEGRPAQQMSAHDSAFSVRRPAPGGPTFENRTGRASDEHLAACGLCTAIAQLAHIIATCIFRSAPRASHRHAAIAVGDCWGRR